jgi:hypothetical protein
VAQDSLGPVVHEQSVRLRRGYGFVALVAGIGLAMMLGFGRPTELSYRGTRIPYPPAVSAVLGVLMGALFLWAGVEGFAVAGRRPRRCTVQLQTGGISVVTESSSGPMTEALSWPALRGVEPRDSGPVLVKADGTAVRLPEELGEAALLAKAIAAGVRLGHLTPEVMAQTAAGVRGERRAERAFRLGVPILAVAAGVLIPAPVAAAPLLAALSVTLWASRQPFVRREVKAELWFASIAVTFAAWLAVLVWGLVKGALP